jgi:hypothetical protein
MPPHPHWADRSAHEEQATLLPNAKGGIDSGQSNADHCHTEGMFSGETPPQTKTPRRMALIGMRKVTSKRLAAPAVDRRRK